MIEESLQAYTESIPWIPQPGPQEDAMFSQADVVLYGGAAGGGKSALACGLAITRAQHTLIMRREATQLKGITREISEIIDPDRKGYSQQRGEWRIPPWDGVKRVVMFGSCPNPGDESKWQGIPRDLLVLDETANFLENQAKFLMGWTRSTTIYEVPEGASDYLHPRQRTRVLMCSNPPTNAEGQWLKEMFAPWLDPNYPNPAAPGELRYFTTIGGVMEEQASGDPIENPNPMGDEDRWIYPKSFTFIPAKVTDNKYLDADYLRELQAMPEPLRSQMLFGSWTAGQEDGEYQIIPSAWVDEAMNRWEERELVPDRVTSTGVDPSRGGRDSTVIATREDWYFHEPKVFDGADMDTGGKVATAVYDLVGESHCPVHVDVIGIGSSVYDHLAEYIGSRAVPVNVAEASKSETDWSGTLKFINKRAELWWRFRDLLNPANGRKLALPRNQRLRAELCTPSYQLMANGIKVESKQDIKKRLGRSTDMADAVIMAAMRSPMVVTGGSFTPRFGATRQL